MSKKEDKECEGKEKEKCKEPKGIRNIRTFVTADALLAAILLVWAQLWIQPSLQLWGQHYNPACGNIGPWFDSFNNSIGFGLAWTYFAVLLALSALAWAGWKTLATSESKTADTAIGLFLASLVMGLANVVQSFFMATFKLFTGRLVFESLVPDGLKWFLVLIIPIVLLSLWSAHRLDKDGNPPRRLCRRLRCLYRWLFRRPLPWYLEPWYLEIGMLALAGMIGVFLMKETLGWLWVLVVAIGLLALLGLSSWWFFKKRAWNE